MLLETSAFPSHVIVDPRRLLPRYWATAWSLTVQASGLSKNTFKLKLRHIDAFYDFCESQFGVDSLDSAVSTRDAASVASMLEAFFLELTANAHYSTFTVQRWDVVRKFIQQLAKLRAPFDEEWSRLSSFLHGIGAMRMPMKNRVSFIRAIPTETLTDLLQVAHPASARNPFLGEANRQRNWLALNLMLLAGLRRGEALILAPNSLKRQFDAGSGRWRTFLLVEINHDCDPRSATPSLTGR